MLVVLLNALAGLVSENQDTGIPYFNDFEYFITCSYAQGATGLNPLRQHKDKVTRKEVLQFGDVQTGAPSLKAPSISLVSRP
jgi:hypothetical protein